MVHGGITTEALLAAGLVDELRLHVAPLILGGGSRMFPDGKRDIALELIESVATPQATHLRYRVLR
jgi:riboflavin biosynthesis pyrimidine reductase